MKVMIHAPAGTATLKIAGGEFTSMSSDTLRFPACKIESFSRYEISVSNTRPDDGASSDHFHFTLDWERYPSNSASIVAQTTTGATMIVVLGEKVVQIGQNESKQVLSIIGLDDIY